MIVVVATTVLAYLSRNAMLNAIYILHSLQPRPISFDLELGFGKNNLFPSRVLENPEKPARSRNRESRQDTHPRWRPQHRIEIITASGSCVAFTEKAISRVGF